MEINRTPFHRYNFPGDRNVSSRIIIQILSELALKQLKIGFQAGFDRINNDLARFYQTNDIKMVDGSLASVYFSIDNNSKLKNGLRKLLIKHVIPLK